MSPSAATGHEPQPEREPATALWVMNADGSDPRRLVFEPPPESSPIQPDIIDWSPDGTRLVYSAARTLRVVDAESGEETVLPAAGIVFEAHWSPDGSSIAYSFGYQGADGIGVIAPDGSNDRVIYEGDARALDWSPDASRVVFIAGDLLDTRLIQIVDVASGAIARLEGTHEPFKEVEWSPDGAWLAFFRVTDPPNLSTGRSSLRLVRPDGTDQRVVTGDLSDEGELEWSPQGTEIAFVASRNNPRRPYGIWIANPIESSSRLLISGARDPNWSPDGSRLAYSLGNPFSELDIFVSDRDGADPRRLTSEELRDDSAPTWSPDGTRIAFRSTRVPIYCGDTTEEREATIVGTQGDDDLEGTSGPDVIAGRQGNDRIDGLEGDDIVCGGSGDDEVVGGIGNDQVSGNTGTDTVDGGVGDDHVGGGLGDDLVQGAEGVDLLFHKNGGGLGVHVNLMLGVASGQGHDELDGIENVSGSSSGDTLIGDDARNLIFGFGAYPDTEIDKLRGRGGDDVLVGSSGIDWLFGGADDDTLRGSFDGDVLKGNGGSDLLLGGRDDDFLDGGPPGPRIEGGGDVLRGEHGRDSCRNGEVYGSCEQRA